MLLHMGDFAYDFDSDGGSVGRDFMNDISNYSSKVPYMVSHGNHENGDTALAHYTERFRLLPSNTGTAQTKQGVAPNSW